jgi:hypothetical protein
MHTPEIVASLLFLATTIMLIAIMLIAITLIAASGCTLEARKGGQFSHPLPMAQRASEMPRRRAMNPYAWRNHPLASRPVLTASFNNYPTHVTFEEQ